MFSSISKQILIPNGIFLRRLSSKLPDIAGNSSLQATIEDKKPPNNLKVAIKSEICPIKLLDTVGQSKQFLKSLSTDNVLDVFQSLFGLYKANKSTITSEQIVQHQSFESLCRKLIRTAPSMQADEVLNALKIINYLQIPANSEITLTLLSLLRYQINDLTLKQIFYVDFLMNQLKPKPKIAAAIKLALPILFEIQAPLQFDPNNLNESIEAFLFGLKVNANEKSLGIFGKNIMKNVEHIPMNKLLGLIISMSKTKVIPENSYGLWKKLIEEYSKGIENASSDELVSSINDISEAIWKNNDLYSPTIEEFFDRSIISLIQNKIGLKQAIYIQKNFKLISFVSYQLLEFIDRQIRNNMIEWKSYPAEMVFTAVQAFAMANFRPSFLKTGAEIFQNENLQKMDLNYSTWYQFALQLLVLGCCSPDLQEKVLDKNYLTKYFQKENIRPSDYERLPILYHEICHLNEKIEIDHSAVNKFIEVYIEKYAKNPIEENLKAIYGNDKILTMIRGKNGILIHSLIKYNVIAKKLESFEVLEKDQFGCVRFDDVKCNENEKLVAVEIGYPHHYPINLPQLKGIFQLRMEQLKNASLNVCLIHPKYWLNVPKIYDTKNIVLSEYIDKKLSVMFSS